MSCPTEELLLRSAEEKAPDLLAHLQDCAACRDTVRELEETIGELRAAAPTAAPASGERLLRLRPPAPSTRAARRLFAVAAAMLLAATGFAIFPSKSKPPRPPESTPKPEVRRTPEPKPTAPAKRQDFPERSEWISGGLGWLDQNQKADGSFGSVGLTGLALMAWFGDGHGDASAAHGRSIQSALVYLLATQGADGLLAQPSEPKVIYGHAIATWALSEAVGDGRTADPRVRLAAQRAVDYLLAAQNPGMAWRYSSKCGDNDTSVTFWAVGALASARKAGFRVPDDSFAGARAFFGSVTDPELLRVGYTFPRTGKVFVPGVNEAYRHHEALSAAAAAARLMMGDARDDAMVSAMGFLVTDLPSAAKETDVDYYYWHLGSLALFLHDGAESFNWAEWENRLLPALRAKRAADGSWEPNDRWGKVDAAGRAYATALNVLTLEVPRRLPAKK